MRFFVVVLLLLGLQACSLIPEPLQVPEDTVLVNYIDVKKDAYAHQGKLARWGGEIAQVVNLPDRTMIEVVNLKLYSSTKPKEKNASQGRFRLYHDGLLDPLIYTQGKYITVLGKVEGVEKGKIGEQEYLFPVISAQGLHIWKKVHRIQIEEDPFYYHSYWGHYHHRRYIRWYHY